MQTTTDVTDLLDTIVALDDEIEVAAAKRHGPVQSTLFVAVNGHDDYMHNETGTDITKAMVDRWLQWFVDHDTPHHVHLAFTLTAAGETVDVLETTLADWLQD